MRCGALRYTLSLIKSTLGDGWLNVERQQVGLAEERIQGGPVGGRPANLSPTDPPTQDRR